MWAFVSGRNETGYGLKGHTLPQQIKQVGISMVQSESLNAIFQISNLKMDPVHNTVCMR